MTRSHQPSRNVITSLHKSGISPQEVVWHQDLSDERLQMYVRGWRAATSPDTPKEELCGCKSQNAQLLTSMTTYMNKLPRTASSETPIVFMLLDDQEGQLYNALIDWQVARSLTEEENASTNDSFQASSQKLKRPFGLPSNNSKERTIVAPDGIVTAKGRWARLWPMPLPKSIRIPSPSCLKAFAPGSLTQARKNFS